MWGQEFTGTVGCPLPLLTFRLEAVPDMGYDPSAQPPRGEIIIKGPVVFQGYFKVRRTCDLPDAFHYDSLLSPCVLTHLIPHGRFQALCDMDVDWPIVMW